MIAKSEVDPAALERGHRLQLKHLAGLGHARGRALGELAELPLAATAVVLDVDQHAGPGAHLLRQHQVDEVLERGQPLALAADEGAQSVLLVAVADNVEAARLAGLDLHADVEAEETHELLEDVLARGENLGRGLGGLEICAFRRERAARGRDLGSFRCRQARGATPARRAIAIVPTRPIVATRSIVPRAVIPRRSIAHWAVI